MKSLKSKTLMELEKIRNGPLEFKDLLHSLRTTEEISQKELADRASISLKEICDFENGRSLPSFEIAKRLANALGHSNALFLSKLKKLK